MHIHHPIFFKNSFARQSSSLKISLLTIFSLISAISSPFAYAQGYGGGYTPPPQIEVYDYKTMMANYDGTGITADVAQLTSGMMGEQYDINTGQLSFRQVDVSLPGNSALPVSFARKALGNGNEERKYSFGALGDWVVDIPHIVTRVDRNTMGVSNRCSSNSVDAEEFGIGYKLNIPGQGEEKLMHFSSGVPLTESISPRPKKATKSYWVVSCGISLTTGTGEGFTVRSPKGFIYKFDKHVRRYAGKFLRHSFDPNKPDLHLDTLYFYPSEVKDVNGNWVKYTYNQYGPTKIWSNDGREIIIQYTGSKITRVLANGREWRYNYTTLYSSIPTSKALTSVVLPDGTSWQYGIGAIRTANGFCQSRRSNSGYINSATVTHPNGTVGKFKFKDIPHAVKNKIVASGYMANKVSIGRPDSDGNVQCSHGYPFPWSFFTRSLIEKKLIEPDGNQDVWTYSYDELPGSWSRKNLSTSPYSYDYSKYVWSTTLSNASIPSDAKRTIIDPEGNKTITYVNRVQAGILEGSVTKVEKYETAASTAPLETQFFDEYERLTFSGDSMMNAPTPIASNHRLLAKKTRTQRGSDVYTTESSYVSNVASASYSFGLPTQVKVSSNLSNPNIPSTLRTFALTHEHNRAKWIIGLTKTERLNGALINQYIYNSLGQLTEQKQFNRRVATYGYHSNLAYKGALSWVKDALNNTTYLSNYKRGTPQLVTRPNGHTFSKLVDNNGWVTKITDYNGNCTNYQYNSIGRLTLMDPCDSRWSNTSVSYSNTTSGEGISFLAAGMLKQTISTGNYQKTVYFDGYYRPVFSKERDASNTSTTRYSRTDYNSAGQVVFQSLPSASTSTAYGVVNDYDGLGRIKRVDNNTTSGSVDYSYLSNNRTRVSDNRGNVTTTQYAAFGSPNTVMPTHIFSPHSVTTSMKYNTYGSLTSINQGGITEYRVYDAYQQLCKTVRPDVGNTAFAYDAKGQLNWTGTSSSINGSLSTCDYSISSSDKVDHVYDSVGNLEHLYYGDSSPDKSFYYDAGNRLTSVSTSNTNKVFTYNSMNLIERETMSIDGQSFVLDYNYDSLGNLSSTVYPSGASISYAPNALGQATRVKYGSTNYAYSAQYHPNGSLKSHYYGSGAQHQTTQFTSGLPQYHHDIRNGQYIYRHKLSYDANSNLIALDDQVNSAYNLRLTYDQLDRLDKINDSYSGTGDVNYDSMGNITYYKIGSSSINYQYNSSKRLASTSGSKSYSFAYDYRGNVVNNGSRSFVYNAANQMVQSGSYQYTYDGQNKRVKEVTNKGTTYSFYSSNGKLMYRKEGSTHVDYYFLGAKLIGKKKGSSLTYLHSDFLGSPVAESTSSGAVTSRMYYQPFGESIGTKKDDAGYTGHKYDSELGLNYMQARYYDPVIGRFYSNDPVDAATFLSGGNIHGFNRYTYANNNPYKYIDPDGRSCTSADGTTTCTPESDEFEEFSFPTPDGWEDFEADDLDFHVYRFEDSGDGASVDNLKEELIKSPTNDSNAATSEGALNNVGPLILGSGKDEVLSYTTKDGIVNVTMENHVAGSGFVARKISENGTIITYGEGNSLLQKMPGATAAAGRFWTENAKVISDRAKQ